MKCQSLAEMTEKSIGNLVETERTRLFLMVEGSQVDWAAHANDPVGIVTEFLLSMKRWGK